MRWLLTHVSRNCHTLSQKCWQSPHPSVTHAMTHRPNTGLYPGWNTSEEPAKKHARVFSNLKPRKDPVLPLSYWPISLLDTIGKLLEKILLTRILWDHVDTLNPAQLALFNYLTEVFPSFFLSCETNTIVWHAKTGHSLHSSHVRFHHDLVYL